jgi:peptidoglycan/LPS O-acetylase OafA/YrhL
LRFLAALMVFMCHFPPTRAFAVTYYLGESGVGFFFLLSGFILTYAHHRDFTGSFRVKAAQAFHLARVARIYPVHLATMALCLAWFIPFGAPQWNLADVPTRIAGSVAQALLLQSWSPNANIYTGLNAVSWSVSVEAFFYVLFPVLLYVLLRAFRGPGQTSALAAALALWIALVAVLLVIRPAPLVLWALYYFPPIRLVDFVVGVLIGIAFLRWRPAPNRIATVAETSCILAVIGAIAVLPALPQSLRFAAALMPLWAVLISVFARQSGAISWFLSHPWCVRLGEISFSFYMVHYVVLRVETHFLGWTHVAVSLCVGLGATLAMSFALYHWVETPMRRRIRGAGAPRPRLPRLPLAPEPAR